jgi:hypothetical protein
VYLLVFTHILLGILSFKSLTARLSYKSFGVKGLIPVGSSYLLCMLAIVCWQYVCSLYPAVWVRNSVEMLTELCSITKHKRYCVVPLSWCAELKVVYEN